MTLIFDPSRSSKVKSHGANRKPVSPTYKYLRDLTSYLSPFSKYFESKFWRWPFDLGRANPWANVHQKGRWPASHPALLSYKISLPYVNPRPIYPLPIVLQPKKQKNSCLDWRISSHADRWSPRNTNSLQHWPSLSKRQPVCDTTHGPRLSSQVCSTRLTTVQRVIDYSVFDLGGLTLGQSSPKGEMTYYPPRSTILQNFSPITQTVYEICYQGFPLFGLRG